MARTPASRRGNLFAPECPSRQVLQHVTSRWGVLVLVALADGERHRFSALRRTIGGVSEKMLAQTLQGLEGDGFVERTVHPVVPPHVDYALTDLGRTLGAAFCGVWTWAAENRERIEAARVAFDEREDARG